MKPDNLESAALYGAASKLCEYGYTVLGQLPEEEKWDLTSKLRQHAFTLSDATAQAEGSLDPRDRMHYYQNAIRAGYGLLNCLKMAQRLHGVAVDARMLAELQEFLDKTHEQAFTARSTIPEYMQMFEMKYEAKAQEQ